jgi:maleylacetate reductase
MNGFIYTANAARVIFAEGAFGRLSEETRALGARALVLSTPEQADLAGSAAQSLGASLFSGAAMHVPVAVVDAAETMLREVAADCLVAVGGGSTTGLAKALALRTDLPIIAVPTTYAGSEMTPIWGLTEGNRKTTGRDMRVLPRTVLYDPQLTATLPVAISVTSGCNAIAHCVEALYAADGNPISALMAEEGIRALAHSLPAIAANPVDLAARTEALTGAWLGGTVLGSTSMALHHKLCHTLGGMFNLPHAELHTALLPHAVAYNAEAAPAAMARIARALATGSAALGLYDLPHRLGAAMALRDLGMPEAGIDSAIGEALAKPYPNPATLDADRLRGLLQRAWAGVSPG